eukprot:CAMPEP_0181238980 /NCGR_PEP_ID=MMETSP1096-20121128/39665_1 /TAXON_ID=156174 ORGANISM="Chrysochromulina ericina, Strain CCMP281" /NCGR_SAMPLE_ID=MMETSP1096 /ASSEMBLY_ACC=CAM_ASM_000453 /LENGTH=90 /DNA_ID=CAMNT_0023334597 /DNA_START=304 /DNA_END=573 /DNA_ORIENTATION=+
MPAPHLSAGLPPDRGVIDFLSDSLDLLVQGWHIPQQPPQPGTAAGGVALNVLVEPLVCVDVVPRDSSVELCHQGRIAHPHEVPQPRDTFV